MLAVASAVAGRSKDRGTQVGACVADARGRIVGTGYNGFPKGAPDALLPTSGKAKHAWTLHAEVNAMLQAIATAGDVTLPQGSALYCTHRPCATCVKLAAHVGVKVVIYSADELSPGQEREASLVAKTLSVSVRRRR